MRCVVVVMLLLGLVACKQHDELAKLNESVKACGIKQTTQCNALKQKLMGFQTLALSLQQSPQQFGLSVMALQNKIAKLKEREQRLGSGPTAQQTRVNLKKKKEALQASYVAHLQVIRWLEAPDAS